MHELSIAISIVEIVCEEAERQGNARVETVHLKIGALSGVVTDALMFAWDIASDGTAAAGSCLAIENVPVAVWCEACRSELTLAAPLDMRCPQCGGSVTQVLRGREMEVTALEVQDVPQS